MPPELINEHYYAIESERILTVNKPDYTVRFFLHGEEVGCFDFGKSPATFTGDVDASAKLFVDTVLGIFEQMK